jgi:hypothetical protein
MLTPSGPRSLNTARVLALVEAGLLVAAWLWIGDVGVSVLVWFQAGQGDWTQLLSFLLVFAAVIAVLVVAGLKLPRRRWARWVVGTLQAISIPVLVLLGAAQPPGFWAVALVLASLLPLSILGLLWQSTSRRTAPSPAAAFIPPSGPVPSPQPR